MYVCLIQSCVMHSSIVMVVSYFFQAADLRIFLTLILAETKRSFLVTPEKSNDFN